MKFLIGLIICLFSTVAMADFKLIELNELKIGYRNYIYSRDPMFTFSTPKEQLNIQANTALFKYGFLDTLVHGTTDNGQYRRIGLQLELGVRLHKYIDFSYLHHSRHLLDTTYPYQKFPCEDSWGIYLYLYRKDIKDTLF